MKLNQKDVFTIISVIWIGWIFVVWDMIEGFPVSKGILTLWNSFH